MWPCHGVDHGSYVIKKGKKKLSNINCFFFFWFWLSVNWHSTYFTIESYFVHSVLGWYDVIVLPANECKWTFKEGEVAVLSTPKPGTGLFLVIYSVSQSLCSLNISFSPRRSKLNPFTLTSEIQEEQQF